MKSISLLLIALLTIAGNKLLAQTDKTDTIKVYGNCSMCKNRIEKAIKVEGVSFASWSPDTKLLVVTYDPSKISNEAIQKNIAAVGHDTEKYSADDKTYEKLPACCHYERKNKNKTD